MSHKIEGFMFDVDGTLILSNRSLGGYTVLPGAVELLSELGHRGVPYVALTNGSNYPPSEQAAKLRKLGLPLSDEQMLTPSSVAADKMSKDGIRSVLLLGTPGVGYSLEQVGIEVRPVGSEKAEQSDAVYVGWHPDCGMKDIEQACNVVWNGGKLYVASDIPFFASAGGRAMGYSHAITAAIRKLTKAPMILTGKPSLTALRFVAGKLGTRPTRVCVVGDDPECEMQMVRRGKAYGIGVTSGFYKEPDWRAQPAGRQPDRLVSGAGEIIGMLDELLA